MFDTGASISLTPFKEDFVGEMEVPSEKEIRGITSSSKIAGVGYVEWTIKDVFGHVCLIRTRAYHVPDSHIRLFSPQTYCKDYGKGPHGYFDHEKLEFTTAEGAKLTFPYTQDGNLPLMLLDERVYQAGRTGSMRSNCASTKVLEQLQTLLLTIITI